MKHLKIENNKGFFRLESEDWKEIDTISKDDLMTLLEKVVNSDFEMDEFDLENLQNKAHQIIYRNLNQKFSELLENKSRFKDESEQLYKSAIEKYSEDNRSTEVG